MPNLTDIVDIAESLENKAVFPMASRCVVVRNRNTKCDKCVKACPTQAITVGDNKFELDSHACVACGACCVVCPTEALVALDPTDQDLAAAIADACIAAKGTAVFACARIASKRLAYPECFAAVPCLARMEESILLALAAQGVTRILLVDGDCQTCKYRYCDQGIEATVASANSLLATARSAIRIERASQFPPKLLAKDPSALYGASRREFFTQAGGNVKVAAEKTVATVLSADNVAKEESLRERLGVSKAGSLPHFEADRHMSILDAMDRMSKSFLPEMRTRLWGSVDVDTGLCNACDACSRFCPTGALKKVEAKVEGRKRYSLEFSLSDCVQCNACEDICLKQCIKVGSRVSTDELFDFEPRVIPLSDGGETRSTLSSLKR